MKFHTTLLHFLLCQYAMSALLELFFLLNKSSNQLFHIQILQICPWQAALKLESCIHWSIFSYYVTFLCIPENRRFCMLDTEATHPARAELLS